MAGQGENSDDMMWKIILAGIPLLAAIVAVALAYCSRRWQSATKEMHARLEASRLPIGSGTYSSEELSVLPAPVQRYFRAVLKDGQPMISAVSLEQTGAFNMSETGEQWRPFTSTQRGVTRRPGFDWEARIVMMPGLTARVHDAYIAGEGILHATLFGLASLANMRGSPEAAHGEFMRFFAEAVWYPTALLPSQGAHWDAVDNTSARAALKDGETSLTMPFRFNEHGFIESVHGEARGRTVAGAVIPTPWEARCRNYELRNGMRIPIEAEAAWILPEGTKPYWRGRVSRLSYEFAQ
jgi:hypothetical protein